MCEMGYLGHLAPAFSDRWHTKTEVGRTALKKEPDMSAEAKVESPQQSVAKASSIDAELVFTIASRAPDVILSFDGLNAPIAMFDELRDLGWVVPPTPPPPGSAIDWTPDPTTGAEYTLRSWKVNEFKLKRSESWAADAEREIGARTIHVLKRHNATISGLRGGTEAEAVAPQGAAQPATPAPTAAPAGSAGVVAAPSSGAAQMIALVEEDANDLPAGASTWSAHSGRGRSAFTWVESPTRDQGAIDSLKGIGADVWSISTDTRTPPAAGMVLSQMVCLDIAKADKQIAKLEKLFGSTPLALELISETGGNNALLISAEIPANTAEMMTSNLLLRFPKMILRS